MLHMCPGSASCQNNTHGWWHAGTHKNNKARYNNNQNVEGAENSGFAKKSRSQTYLIHENKVFRPIKLRFNGLNERIYDKNILDLMKNHKNTTKNHENTKITKFNVTSIDISNGFYLNFYFHDSSLAFLSPGKYSNSEKLTQICHHAVVCWFASHSVPCHKTVQIRVQCTLSPRQTALKTGSE